MSHFVKFAGAGLVTVALAFPAAASTIVVTHIRFSDSSRFVTISDAPPGAITGPVRAGRYELATDASDDILVWCVDIFRTLGLGPGNRTYTTTFEGLVDDAATPPNLLTPAQISRVNGLVAAGDAALEANPGNGVISAAYQAAIWETIYPTASFTSTQAGVQPLIDILNASPFAGHGGTLYERLGPNGVIRTQVLFGGSEPDPVVPVPAPAAIALFGFALAGLLAARRVAA